MLIKDKGYPQSLRHCILLHHLMQTHFQSINTALLRQKINCILFKFSAMSFTSILFFVIFQICVSKLKQQKQDELEGKCQRSLDDQFKLENFKNILHQTCLIDVGVNVTVEIPPCGKWSSHFQVIVLIHIL